MAENTILQAGDWSSFAKLSKFENKEEMDLAIRSWLYQYKHELKLSEEELVKKISQLAFKLKGVFAIKHEKLAALLNVSAKTVQRGLDRLIKLGLITVHETRTTIKAKTAKGKGNPKGRGHNVYVINSIEHIDFENIGKKVENESVDAAESIPVSEPVQSAVQSVVSSRSIATNVDVATVEQAKNESDTGFSYTKPSKRIKSKNISTSADNINMGFEESDLVGHWVPETFKQKALLLFDTAKNVNAAYNIIRKKVLTNKFVKFSLEDIEEFGRLTLNAYYKKIKETQQTGGKVETPFGYVNGIIENILDEKTNAKVEEEYKAVMLEMYSPVESDDSSQSSVNSPFFYNWLEERD